MNYNDYNDITRNGMNMAEILIDLSRALNINVLTSKKIIASLDGLLNSVPKHSNLYYVIVEIYNKKVPRWFADKYTDIEPDRWSEYIDN